MSSRGLIDGRVGIDLASAAELVHFAGVFTAVRANVAWRKDLIGAVRTDLADERVTLLFQSPMLGCLHASESIHLTLSETIRNAEMIEIALSVPNSLGAGCV